MALSLEYVRRRFELAANDFPGMTHVLLCRERDALSVKELLPAGLQPAPAVNLGNRFFKASIGIDLRQTGTPPHYLDGWDFAHWHFLRWAELLRHDVEREHEASKKLLSLTDDALRVLPNSQRIAGHDADCEWLLVLQNYLKPLRFPVSDAWYAVIPDVFLASLDLLTNLEVSNHSETDPPYLGIRLNVEQRTATRDGYSFRPIAFSKLQWQALLMLLKAKGARVPRDVFVPPAYDGSTRGSALRTKLAEVERSLIPLEVGGCTEYRIRSVSKT